MINKLILNFKNDHLYRNSIYLIASTAVIAVFGFFFWIVAARQFTTQQVGVATTLISMATLLSGLSVLGLNVSLNRFLPKSEERNEMISSSFILVSLAGIIATVIFLLGVSIFSPQLSFLSSNFIYILTFIVFIIILSLNSLSDNIFVAYRASGNILFKNSVLSILKLIFIFLFTAFGAYGIFSSYTTALAVSFFLGMGILIYNFNFRPIYKVNINLVKKMAKFSLGNYAAGLLTSIPLLVLPVIIINSIGAASSAYFYIDTMILGILVTIPQSVSQSLLTEGSHDETALRQHIIKASKITYLLLIPSVIVIFFFGNYILHFFGKSYAEDAFRFLQIISLSALVMPISLFGSAVLKIEHKITALIIFSAIGCFATLGICYLLVSFGLVGVGLGLLIGQIIISIIYALYYLLSKRKRAI